MRLARKVIESQSTTIFALSSGRPPAGIAIVRLSGSQAFAVLKSLSIGSLPPFRQLVRRRLVDHDGSEIDFAMVVCFAASASPTGEDLVEFHLHGGVAVVAAMLKALAAFPDVALAKQGAFTRRAFDNGRINLTQVEGLADLIDAETESQRRLALNNAGSALHRHVDIWRSMIIEARTYIEATLDFADENDVAQHHIIDIDNNLLALRNQLIAAIADIRRASMIREGVTIAIVGPVNTGKSSLINSLAARDVSIVSDIAGTTRDVIEVRLNLNGIAAVILDTAGIRSSVDSIELEGIRRGRLRAANADLIIAVGDSSTQAGLHLVSKSDQLMITSGWHDETLYVSSVTGAGIDLLIVWLTEWARKLVRLDEPILLAQHRHADAVKTAIVALDLAMIETDMLLMSEHLKAAADALDMLIGRLASDDLLDAIFSRFCIGK